MESYKMFKPEKADRGRATHTHTKKNKKQGLYIENNYKYGSY